MGKRGRVIGSTVRDNLVDLLYFLGEDYGYSLYKKYRQVFGQVNRRLVYYHLKKGMELGLFKISKVEEVTGEYSWGTGVQRIKYSLDAKAQPKADLKIKEKLATL